MGAGVDGKFAGEGGEFPGEGGDLADEDDGKDLEGIGDWDRKC